MAPISASQEDPRHLDGPEEQFFSHLRTPLSQGTVNPMSHEWLELLSLQQPAIAMLVVRAALLRAGVPVLVQAPPQPLASVYPKNLECSGRCSAPSPLLHLSPNPATSQKTHQMPPENRHVVFLSSSPISSLVARQSFGSILPIKPRFFFLIWFDLF